MILLIIKNSPSSQKVTLIEYLISANLIWRCFFNERNNSSGIIRSIQWETNFLHLKDFIQQLMKFPGCAYPATQMNIPNVPLTGIFKEILELGFEGYYDYSDLFLCAYLCHG